jgi:hypothetical protein
MDEPTDRHEVTDPFQPESTGEPSIASGDGETQPPKLVWPIPSPRVRKAIESKVEEVADQHFFAKIVAAVLAAGVFVVVGVALYLVDMFAFGYRVNPLIFGLGYTVFFAFLVALANHLRSRDPLEYYREAEFPHSSEVPVDRRRGLRGLPRLLFYIPGVVGASLRKLLEPPPPTDEDAVEAALRMLPVLHQPLPLARAEEAGLGGPDVIRRATLLLHSLDLADLIRDGEGDLLVCPRGTCADLLRGTPFEADGIGAWEQTIKD